MDAAHSDALVFFGITGDLAFKKRMVAKDAKVRWDNCEPSESRLLKPDT